jgi:hypothetical protein
MRGCHATECTLAPACDARGASAWRRIAARFAPCEQKKAHFLAPKSILLHHSAGGWM